ncbi:hypothetical protein [Gemmatimonas sp.]|uniref:hypothetical protein n=1 Tax=Gemmatimonas sp. TaxID=1962908 RepID=UPI0022C71720|nr:hypothetical protein [Gemmatimonas sp.]MCZ8203648.1 hypothetical protein [Gemmatimonas sp.]
MPSDPEQDLGPGDVVQFEFSGVPVRGTIRRVDEKALATSPFGLPYLVTVTDAPPASGYRSGRDYTLRAASLVRLGEPAPRAAPWMGRRVASAPALTRFLVGYRREGGEFGVQGTLLVQAPSLDAAKALATTTLQTELDTDVAAGREAAGASVMLVNAAEVSTTASGSAAVLAQVRW